MIKLLSDPNQNRRILVQSLAVLDETSLNPILKKFIQKEDLSLIEKGAAIAASYKISGEKDNLYILKNNLFDKNQNNRQCAVQDIIDAQLYDFIPHLIRSPISPSLRFRALDLLASENSIENNNKYIDQIINNDLYTVNILHSYSGIPKIEFLIEELFHTDFSRSYLALKILLDQDPNKIWPLIQVSLARLKKDYGAFG